MYKPKASVDVLRPASSSSFSSHMMPSRSHKGRAQLRGYRTSTSLRTPRPSGQRHYALTPLALLVSIPPPPAGNVPEALLHTGSRPIPLGRSVRAHRLTSEIPPFLSPWLASSSRQQWKTRSPAGRPRKTATSRRGLHYEGYWPMSGRQSGSAAWDAMTTL